MPRISRIVPTMDSGLTFAFPVSFLPFGRIYVNQIGFRRLEGCSRTRSHMHSQPEIFYMVRLKMKKAQSLLKKKIPAKVVAEKLGYEEIYSFYRMFHKKVGRGIPCAIPPTGLGYPR